MLVRLIPLLEKARDSLWAVPLLMSAASVGLFLWAFQADIDIPSDVWWLFSADVAAAREFEATLVSGMITLASLAFSVTMIVLSLAAQQLGPRLIEVFMRDWRTQVSLGLFLATIFYLLLMLRALNGVSDENLPGLAVTISTTLVLLSVITLLFFVHTLGKSIVADHVIMRVGEAFDHAIKHVFPEEPANGPAPPRPPNAAALDLDTRGYVARIDYEALARTAARCNARIWLAYHVGAYVLNGEPDVWVDGASPEDLRKSLRGAIAYSPQRGAAGGDPEWSARQLVEIALRALSPGINDVFTAIAVIDRLALSLSIALRRYDARAVWCDEAGSVRVIGPAPAISLLIATAFDQIREAGADKHAILAALAKNLEKLARISVPRHLSDIEAQAEMLQRAAQRGLSQPRELADVEQALAQLRETLRERGA